MMLTSSITGKIKQNLKIANSEFEDTFVSLVADLKDIPFFEENSSYAHRIISYNPNNTFIKDSYIDIDSAVRVLSDVINKFTGKIKENPNREDLWNVLGNCYLLMCDFPNAYTSYMHVQRINQCSKNAYYWFCCGVCYQHFKYNEDASKCYNMAMNLEQNFKEVRDLKFRLALCYRMQFKFQESIDLFKSLVDSPPQHLREDDIEYHLAFTYQANRQIENAYEIYIKLYKKYPNVDLINQQLLWFLSLQNDPKYLVSANEIISNLSEEQKLNPNIILSIAKITLKQQKYEEACNYYQKCSKYFTNSPLFWNSLGILYCNKEKFDDAKVAFQNALISKSDVVEAWLNLGFLFEKIGDLDTAKRIYETGLNQCSTNNKLFQERIINIVNKNIRSVIMDIDETMYIVQAGDSILNDIFSTVPSIPPEQLGVTDDITNVLSSLKIGFKSLFTIQT